MAPDYPDWCFPNWIIDQSAELYFQDVFAKMIINPVYTERRLIKEGGVLYVWGSLKVKDSGVLMVVGTLRVFGD